MDAAGPGEGLSLRMQIGGCVEDERGVAEVLALLQFAAELKPFDAKEGTIRFTVEKPLPVTLIKKIAKARAAENRARRSAKGR